jgi:hypothetical protein
MINREIRHALEGISLSALAQRHIVHPAVLPHSEATRRRTAAAAAIEGGAE